MPEDEIYLRFAVETERGLFRDALSFTPAEYAAETPETLAAAKQARADAWVAHVNAMAEAPEQGED